MIPKSLHVSAVLAFALLASGCGGGGGTGTAPAPAPSTAPSPAVTATPLPTLSSQAFHIIGPAGVRSLAVAPAGATIVLPPGYTNGGTVANAVITYPDGSAQVADANGIFAPATSSYGVKYAVLQTDAVTQPHVKVVDPAGGSAGVTVVNLGGGTAPRVAGVTVVPTVAQVFPGEPLTLVAAVTDADDRVAGLGAAQIVWTSALGATITPIPGTNQATYVSPQLASGSENDVVTATVTTGASQAYSSTAAIMTIGTASAFTASGSLTTGSGSAIPGGYALFVQSDAPRAYPSFDFPALADASGAYTRLLPANSDFNLALIVPASLAPVAGQTVYPASGPGGDSSFTTGAAGASATLNLAVSSDSEFDDSKDDAKNAIPDPVVSIRDAWLAVDLAQIYPFWADAGILPLLSGAHTDGAPVSAVGSGLLAHWCYQWQARGSSDVLVLVENANAGCTSPGNLSFEVTTQGGTSYAFTEYRLLHGAYALSSPLDDQNGAQLVATGSWAQSVTSSGATITSDAAAVSMHLFGPLSTGTADPVTLLSLQYGYTAASASSATTTFSNASLTDASNNLPLAAASGSFDRTVATNTCAGTASTCYAGSLSIARSYALTTGTLTQNFSAAVSIAGDGSSQETTSSLTAGDASTVRFPIAAAVVRAAGSCIVCAGGGALLDVDGTTQLGSFSVTAAQLANFSLLNSSEGGTPGTAISSSVFPL